MFDIKNIWPKSAIALSLIAASLLIADVWLGLDHDFVKISLSFNVLAIGSVLSLVGRKRLKTEPRSPVAFISLGLTGFSVFLSLLSIWRFEKVDLTDALLTFWILSISTNVHNMISFARVMKSAKNIVNCLVFTLSIFLVGIINGVINNDLLAGQILTTLVVLVIVALPSIGICHAINKRHLQ